MELKKLEIVHDGRKFSIEEDYSEVGSYLYVFENDRCVRDFLQDDVETCKLIAFEEYGVPLDKWIVKKET